MHGLKDLLRFSFGLAIRDHSLSFELITGFDNKYELIGAIIVVSTIGGVLDHNPVVICHVRAPMTFNLLPEHL